MFDFDWIGICLSSEVSWPLKGRMRPALSLAHMVPSTAPGLWL